MQPNTTVLFKDVNNKILYEKKTDSQGISEIKAYRETTGIAGYTLIYNSKRLRIMSHELQRTM